MLPPSECRVPIRIKVTGRLDDDDLARLEATVANVIARRLTWYANGPARPAATPGAVLMATPPGVPVDGEVEIPSYQGPPGARVRVPVHQGGGTQTGPSPLELPAEGVQMPWVGKGAAASELGYLRDTGYFWSRFRTAHPDSISPRNATLIEAGRSPVVDATWVRHYPQHRDYLGETLEHHHVGQGAKAVPLPARLHDAYTVFHPQRRVVGTPAGGTRPLPPAPDRNWYDAQIARHTAAGRIRVPGGTPPPTPQVPVSSEVAGVPVEQRRPTGGAAAAARPLPAVPVRQPVAQAPTGEPGPARPPTPPPRATPAGAGRGGSGWQAGAAAGIAVIVERIVYHFLRERFADEFADAARQEIAAAVERKRADLDALLAARHAEIAAAQADGRKVILRVAVDTNWQATDLGNALYRAEVGDVQLVFEDGPAPRTYSRPRPGGLLGDVLRDTTGTELRTEIIDIELPGTDVAAAQRRTAHRRIEARTRPAAGPPADFELLVIEALGNDQQRDELREYAEYRVWLAGYTEDPATAAEELAYWRFMAELVDGPVEALIAAARYRKLPLGAILRYAKDHRDRAAVSDPAEAAYWSDVVRLIEDR